MALLGITTNTIGKKCDINLLVKALCCDKFKLQYENYI